MADDASRVLRGLDAVRLRPAMYVGDVGDGSGLHRLVELAVLDALARRPARVDVTLRGDGSVEVADDGGPFPEAVGTALGFLRMYEPGHLALVNALSSRFEMRQRRDGEEWLTRFRDGRLVAPSVIRAAGGEPETRVAFLASREVFAAVAYDRALVARRLGDLGEPGTLLTLT